MRQPAAVGEAAFNPLNFVGTFRQPVAREASLA
jgi:hypothetical protein